MNLDDLLLTDEELYTACRGIPEVSKAQRDKAVNGVVGWLFSPCTEHGWRLSQLSMDCSNCWQELRKAAGLEE